MRSPRYHLILDVSACQPERLTDAAGLEQFLKELVEDIGMHVLKGPVTAVGIPENPGLSCFVIIDYSHISIHTFTEYNEAMVDIFSCKPFDKEKARAKTLAYFQTSDSDVRENHVWNEAA